MANLGSFIRSAARATFYAYRRVPVRWRLGGGSAALTFVILASVAIVTDVLTDRQLSSSFHEQTTGALGRLALELNATTDRTTHQVNCQVGPAGDLTSFAESDSAQIRFFSDRGRLLCSQALATKTFTSVNHPYFRPPARNDEPRPTSVQHGYYVATSNKTPWKGTHRTHTGWLYYARPLSSLDETISEVRIYLTGGVLAGTILAMLAGLLVAQRAMRPVVELTEVAREIERTRDPSLRIPHPDAEDEVADLARTLESMLGALNEARTESETALMRQREFVADASHELRTPLTSVLANLELLADELGGEQAESAKSALRSTRRMRRLVADLLLLARADVGREQPHRLTNLATHLTDAAAELGRGLDDHGVTVNAEPAPVEGVGDDLHRLILNLLENALNHTPAGTQIVASSGIRDGHPVLVIQDDGPGIDPKLQQRVFERFVRGGGDTGSHGTGLGLAIVDAVASSHGATVRMKSLPEVQGTRFEIRFPPPAHGDADAELPATDELRVVQTSTTTGRTIGRRRSRS
ncbi:MAG: sensor histidine kinase [Solirubrobacteraceae bacterium]